MDKPVNRLYEFGPFRLDAGELCLRRDGKTVSLTPKVFHVLAVLVERHGSVVEKDELMRIVWPDTHVEKGNLTQSVSVLRKALDEFDPEKYVETIPKRGYRFIAPVVELREPNRDDAPSPRSEPCRPSTADEPDRPHASHPHPSRRSAVLGTAVSVLLTIGFAASVYRLWSETRPAPADAAPTMTTVIVAPFRNVRATDAEGVADRLADLLASKLNTFPGLRAIADPGFQIRGLDPGLTALATASAPSAKVEGTIEHLGDRVVVDVKMTDVPSGKPIWAEKLVERALSAIEVRERIADRLAYSVHVMASGSLPKSTASKHVPNPEAFEAYQLGRYFWNNRSHQGLMKSFAYLERAIEKDPNYAEAHAALAQAYAFDLTRWREAETLIVKAFELDPTLSEPHAALGFIKLFHEWNWEQAEREFQAAVRLNPSDATAHQWYAACLTTRGKHFEAVVHLKKAVQLDPLSPSIRVDLGQVYYFQQEAVAAIEQCRKTLELSPDFLPAHQVLFEIHLDTGRQDEAFEEYLTIERLSPHLSANEQSLRKTHRASGMAGILEIELDYLHRHEIARRYALAQTHARLDNREQALFWLEKAYENHEFQVIYVKVDPAFRTLNDHPRFQDILKRLGI